MWSSDRLWFGRRAALAALLALAACGYQPVNAPDGSATGLRSGEIAVQAPEAEDEFALVERLEQRLGRGGRAQYDLGYRLKVDEDAVGVRPNQETLRYNVIGRIDWTLTDRATGATITSGGFESFSSYAASGQPVSGLTAQQDAHKRLVVLLADQLVTKLSATADEWRAAAK
jgi:LPS-assembly lipoprotein